MGLVKRTYVDGETVITADNLNDIQDAIIQNEEDITTKGTYSKPTGGIPKTDLASAVQTSLGKADTALQSSDIDSTLAVAGKAADAKKTGDEISDVKNTLNHKADVIYDTASGDIASFPDGADGLPVKDLTVAIEPVQSGTGDPSPTNVRPISGWTGCNVTRAGKNLLESAGQSSLVDSGVTFTKNADGSVSANGTCGDYRTYYIITNQFNPVTDSLILNGCPSDGGSNKYEILLRNINGSAVIHDYGNGASLTGISIPGTFEVAIIIRPGVTATNLVFKPMVRLSSDSDSTYEPYSSTALPISWQSSAGTVYGGTLDVTSGVLTVDRATESYNSSSGFADHITRRWYHNGLPNGASDVLAIRSKAIANIAKCVVAGYTYGPYFEFGGSGFYLNKLVADETLEELNTRLQSTPLVFCYFLATPQTYQITPTEVTTLLGQNNVWADCGPSTVEYPCDTKLYIQKINAPSDDDMIADAQIASGKYFIVGNNLYLSTAAILAGDPIKPGTNCTLTNLAAALNAINS